jgi:hypothetical protein
MRHPQIRPVRPDGVRIDEGRLTINSVPVGVSHLFIARNM